MTLAYALAAEAVVFLHFAWIVFVVTGAFFLYRRPRWRFLHLLAVLYSLAIEVFVWTCPLTYLEQWLWRRAGREAYRDAFITHYLEEIIYWRAPQWLLIALVGLVAAVTLFLYYVRPAGSVVRESSRAK